jgi:Ca2+-binding EF-hand superfamily protein
MPSQATLYMSWREKEALRVKEKKELRRMVRRSMSTQELSNEMADAAARSRPMSSSYGRPNRNRSRPATPDSIFGDSEIVGDAPRGGAASRLLSEPAQKMSMDEAEDVVSAKDTAVWVGSVPDSVDEDELERIMSMFGEVSAVSLRSKHGNKSWGFVLFKEPVVAKQAKSFGVVCHEEHTIKVREPDFANMSNADMRSMAHVWREALKKTSYGKFIDDFRRHIEGSVPGGANSMLRLFKEFRSKSGSDDNNIDVAEFGRALKACNIYMTDQEVKRLHKAMDTNGNGQLDINEFSSFIVGRYDALGAAASSSSLGAVGTDTASHGKGDKKWNFKRPSKNQTQNAGIKSTSAVESSIWVGNIPASFCDEELLKIAAARAFGPVDHVTLRRKGEGKPSWAMIMMLNHDDVKRAVVAGKLTVKDPEFDDMIELLVQPVALKKELGSASGQLADVWRKTLSKTSHGKNLDLFRHKIESKIEGGANSVLKLFKQFRQTAGSANNEITADEFKFCVAKLNLGMSDSQVQALFSDIDMDHGGSIGLQEFELAILGRVGELG